MPKSDRAFRTLARNEPEVVAAMLEVLVPEIVPTAVQLIPDDVAPTHIDALPPEIDADWAARVHHNELLHVECQGYRDDGFSARALWYHLGFALRNRGKRRVRTIALWLVPLPVAERRDVVTVGDISVKMTTIVLPDIPAEKLLAHPRTACFAAGANRGAWSDDELCRRVATALASRRASWAERHMAVVAAAMRKRYDAMLTAMEQAHLEPVIIEDLVKIGEDRGYDRGRIEPYARWFARSIGRPLSNREQETLRGRLDALGTDRIDEVYFNSTGDVLAAWLTDPTAS